MISLKYHLGADDPVVKKTLGKQSPEEVATAAVKGSQLRDPALRKKLWEGGAKEVDASQDPMIALARLVDADARAFRKRYEDEVEAVEKKNGALLARARFELFGTGTYPDATFTLRLSYGTVKGWEEAGRKVEPITTFSGAFARHTGREPFALAKSFLAAEKEIDPATPFDLCTTNDIIGGNSGSPMVDREGKVVGLIFDGNLPSLGGRYGFDPGSNRAVGVHSVGIQTGLSRIYAAERVAKELGVAK